MQHTVRVNNLRMYPIGICLQNGREYSIRPGGFVQQSREDIEWLASIAPTLFDKERQLRLDDRELAVELSFIESKDSRPLDDSEIHKQLEQSAAKIKTWIEGISEPYLLNAIFEVAMTMDLSTSKLKILQEKMPAREFLPVDGE